MNRIVLVTKPSRLEMLRQQHLTEGAAAFVLETRGQSIEEYRQEELAYEGALTEVRRQLPSDIPTVNVSREEIPYFLFRDTDLVVVCGPDGLFANLAKYLGSQPVITVNPDKRSVAGTLMLFAPSAVRGAVLRVLERKHQSERIPFVKAVVDNETTVWGINDIFIGRKDHVSSRYSITHDKVTEAQSSSGIIISTGLGSTGWMRSVMTMAASITGGTPRLGLPCAVDEELVFVVREPFPSPNTGTRLVYGRITRQTTFQVNSEMAEGGYVSSDGVTEQATPWNSGSSVEISVGDRYIHRVIPTP